jgi:hypothetical protein
VEVLQSVAGADLLRHLAAPSQREQLTHEFVLGFLAADTDSGAGWGSGSAPRQPSRRKKQHASSGGGVEHSSSAERSGVALPAPRGLQGQVAEHLLGGSFDEALLESVPTHTLNWVIKVGAGLLHNFINFVNMGVWQAEGARAGWQASGQSSTCAGQAASSLTPPPARSLCLPRSQPSAAAGGGRAAAGCGGRAAVPLDAGEGQGKPVQVGAGGRHVLQLIVSAADAPAAAAAAAFGAA